MPQTISLRTKAEIFLFTLTRTVINSGYRMVYPLLPLFATGMGMQLADLSIAFSIRSVLGIFNPFLASLANARGRKNGLMLGAVLFFVGCGITALGQNFLSFIIGLSVFGVGNGIFIPSMQAYLGERSLLNAEAQSYPSLSSVGRWVSSSGCRCWELSWRRAAGSRPSARLPSPACFWQQPCGC